MKLFTVLKAFLLVASAVHVHCDNQNLRRNKSIQLQECEYDCDTDDDCVSGLQCADAHKPELKAAGLDVRKAYCSPDDKPGDGFTEEKRNVMEVCYNPAKVVPIRKKLNECEYDCDQDTDCASGLNCADAHKAELKAAGLDVRKAYCSKDGMPLEAKFLEVCYDPKNVVPIKKRLLECEYDCDVDADCDEGLLCADAHKPELREKNRDPRKAYCPKDGMPPEAKFLEVCYDPTKV